MQTRSPQSRSVIIPPSRWLAYAGAGAATAFAGVAGAEAEIHYSGRVDVTFQSNQNGTATFPLDRPGDYLAFAHSNHGGGGAARFKAEGIRSGSFAGSYPGFEYAYVARLNGGDRYISRNRFTFFAGSGFHLGTMVDNNSGSVRGDWKKKGPGYVGFRFDGGAGTQYGWARVYMGGRGENYAFKVLDYAYADPGETIRPGQTTSSSAPLPNEGSLGLLAVGAAGLVFWRQQRKWAMS